jgi:TolA-binding protein
MNTATRRIAIVAVALVAALNIAPAAAMGRSGAPTRAAEPVMERLDRAQAEQKNLEAGVQAQIESLRKEVAELKAQLAAQKVVAIAQ